MVYSHAAQLHATNVQFSRAGNLLIHDLSLTVQGRDRLVLVGPNGVGKSTLLALLSGSLSPSLGSIRRQPEQATVGLLAQEVGAAQAVTVAEFLSSQTGVFQAEAELDSASLALAESNTDTADRYDRALEQYLSLGGPDFGSRMHDTLAQVGLAQVSVKQEVMTLSGGQRSRLGLAAILLSRFDVLLLDEPTNDLDAEGLELLERFVDTAPIPMVLVSHDQAFIRRTLTGVLELDPHTHGATAYSGSWDAYMHEKKSAETRALHRFEAYQQERANLVDRSREVQSRLDKGIKAAKNHPDNDVSLRNARLERTEQRAGDASKHRRALDRLVEVDKPWQEWALQFRFGAASRSGDRVLQTSAACFTRGSFTLGPVDLDVVAGDRIDIAGPNGSGKSSLIALLLGEVKPTTGSVETGKSVVVGHLDQSRLTYCGSEPLLDTFLERAGCSVNEARSILAKFGLGPGHVARPSNSLSPGERTRAALAQFQLKGVNLLVLDEPTNHLDLAATEQLGQAVSKFSGTLIVVSHDRDFLSKIMFTRRIDVEHGSVTQSGFER